MIPIGFIIAFLGELEFFNYDKNQYNELMIFPLLLIPITYLAARWSLLFPSIAVDNRKDLSWAWTVSSGNGFQLFILIGILPTVTSLINDYLLSRMDNEILLQFILNISYIANCPNRNLFTVTLL